MVDDLAGDKMPRWGFMSYEKSFSDS